MFTGRKKIVKPEGQTPDEFEEKVAQELFNLEVRLPPAAPRRDLARLAARLELTGPSDLLFRLRR